MNLGKGFLMPQESGGLQPGNSWIPVTPEKPVARNNGVILNGSHWIPASPEPVVRNDKAIHGGEPWIPVTPGNTVLQTTNPLADQMQRSLVSGMNPHALLGLPGRISAEQPVMRTTYPVLGQVQGSQSGNENWPELIGYYGGLLQEEPSYGASQVFNPTALSIHGEHSKQDTAAVRTNGYYNQSSNLYMQNLTEDFNRAESRVIKPTHKLPFVSTYRASGDEWANHAYPNPMLPQQKQALSSNQGIITSSLQNMPSDGIPIRYNHVYNLNSPPRAESSTVSSGANYFQSAPITPEQTKQWKNHQLSDTQNFPTDGSLRQQKDEPEILSISKQGDNLLDEPLDNDVATLPCSNTASLKENEIPGEVGQRGIDLNKTPTQRTPRRKKHRPKVVVEGKPKKTPKPTATETKLSDKNPSGKRKHVCRNDLGSSNSTPGNESFGIEPPAPSSVAKTCRKVLNFDQEGKMNDNVNKMVLEEQPTSLKSMPFDLNLKSQEKVWSKEFDGIPNISAPMAGHQTGHNADSQQGVSIHDLIGDSHQKFAARSPQPVHPVSTPTSRGHTLDSIARSLNLQTTISCQNNNQFGFNQGHQPLEREGTGKMPLQANYSLSNFYGAQPLCLRASTASVKEIAEAKEERGSKRDFWHTSRMMNPQSADVMHIRALHCGTLRNEHTNDIGKTGVAAPETNKRTKFDDPCRGLVCNVPSCIASVQGSSRQIECNGSKGSHVSSSSTYLRGSLPNVNLGGWSNFSNQNTSGREILSDWGINIATAGNGRKYQSPSRAEQNLRFMMAGKKLYQSAEANNHSVTARITDCIPYPSQIVPAIIQGNEARTSSIDLSVQRHTMKPAATTQDSQEQLHLNVNKTSGCQKSPVKTKELTEKPNYAVTINEIIDRLERLEIGKSGKKLAAKEQNAIVPYKGDDKVVPYEGFDPIKRQKPRPKVDLDPETNRLWNILMGKAGFENTETADHGKEKWWEEERKVVRGRIDSFIARMHLVQGDRRFSPWKGSVVDSVIGVFLTQNVSDHLSSSAFISLASKFPIKLTTSKTIPRYYESISWIEESDVQTIDPDGTITYHGSKMRQPFNRQSLMTLSVSPEKMAEHLISRTGVHHLNENSSGIEEEVVSSQNSSDSFPLYAKYMRSSSDSEVEDQIMMYNSKKYCISESTSQTERIGLFQPYQCQPPVGNLIDNHPMARHQQQGHPACTSMNLNEYACPVNLDSSHLPPSSGSWLNKTSSTGVHGSYSSGFSEHKSTSSFYSNSSEITRIGSAAYATKNMGVIAGSASSSTSQGPVNHAIRMGQTQCSNQQHEDKSQAGFHFVSSQESVNSNQTQTSKSFQQEGKSVMEPKRRDAADVKGQTGNTYLPGEQFSNTDTNSPNAKKRKKNVEKKDFDWDSLRRKVLEKNGKKERSPENMDSLDYEALRHADVKKISDTILERGMNNMLAERIKDFLNRLVRDHGSVDLEWLREVEGDEAKDYLLSIRGLGLKSVECVRLLTLHQIAFPVDTNVGRIAVRLGWVPLQPLPESLQLHLLELYPILESVQKYLWPRLCKMDQRTLYELHYQLITFGKVFCTKRKPNCNACPMRAECRHFASAFASARLALPAPEERSLVTSTTPAGANEIPPIIVEPIPLLPVETSMGTELHYGGSKCEPIIEEPTTPEPSPEVLESDIEDLFYEDPDEIPTIKLSSEELRVNLESVIRDNNIELQPGDLSMALVALDASTASIPVPKLKNASRLRTEHQVYELPDSHPLLKDMERREPDDPSPYLLAIWGPDETADSSQPPEGCCSRPYENNSQTVRGTLLIPCRTAMRGSFPLNGTYFQVNEMFADHESSKNPIDVPRDWLWQLSRRTVYFGTSVTSIFRGLTTEGIQYCFWRGFVCVRGFDRQQRAPRPLDKRLHESTSTSRMVKNKNMGSNQKKANAGETTSKAN